MMMRDLLLDIGLYNLSWSYIHYSSVNKFDQPRNERAMRNYRNARHVYQMMDEAGIIPACPRLVIYPPGNMELGWGTGLTVYHIQVFFSDKFEVDHYRYKIRVRTDWFAYPNLGVVDDRLPRRDVSGVAALYKPVPSKLKNALCLLRAQENQHADV